MPPVSFYLYLPLDLFTSVMNFSLERKEELFDRLMTILSFADHCLEQIFFF